MKEWAEYVVVRVLLKILEVLPRRIARPLAASAARILFLLSPKLRKTAEFNLRLAFPDWTVCPNIQNKTSKM
jgi:lauroyl/myristoyl acyltransferase